MSDQDQDRNMSRIGRGLHNSTPRSVSQHERVISASRRGPMLGALHGSGHSQRLRQGVFGELETLVFGGILVQVARHDSGLSSTGEGASSPQNSAWM